MTTTTEPATTPADPFPVIDLAAHTTEPAPVTPVPAVAEQSAVEPTPEPEAAPPVPVAEPTEPEVAASAPASTPEADDDEAQESAAPSPLAAACAAGTVKLFRLRGTGTVRRLPFLTDGSPAREVAEWYRMRVEEGASVRDIAAEAEVSKATVRRNLYALAVTESVEEGELDELWGGPEDTELVLAGGWGEDDSPEEDAANMPTEAPAEPAATEPFVCDWEGHASAVDEAGMCPVCQ